MPQKAKFVALLIGAAVGALIGGTTAGVHSYNEQKAKTGKVDGWKVAKDALVGAVIGGTVGAVTAGAGAAVAGGLAAAAGTATLTSIASAGISAVASGVVGRYTNSALNNNFTNNPKTNPIEEAFNPDAMMGDALLGSAAGAFTNIATGGKYPNPFKSGGKNAGGKKSGGTTKTSSNVDDDITISQDENGNYSCIADDPEIASSAAQYQRLKQSLAEEEIQSVIKTTDHGAKQLISRGFNPSEISDVRLSPNKVMTQTDGAKVYIKNIGEGKFNVIVESENGAVTALKNIGQNSIDRLSKNYGWK